MECGVSEIMIDGFNLKPGVWKNMNLILCNNIDVLELFSKNLKNMDYYTQIRNEIIEFGRFKKVKIVDAATGEKPTISQFTLRYLCYYVSSIPLFLGILWVGIDKRKQGWHDKIAGTVVIKE